MALVRVYYTDNMSAAQFERALTCRRCRGTGRNTDTMVSCMNCGGDGFSRDNGWTYAVPDDWDLEVGDKIVVPPTPRCNEEQVATVVGLDATFKIKSKLKHAVRRA